MGYQSDYYYVLIPIIQIVFYVFASDLVNHWAHTRGLVYSRGVPWGLTAEMYAIDYVVIVIGLVTLTCFFPGKALLLSMVASFSFGLLVYPVLDAYPYRGGVTILIGVTGIFIHYLLLVINSVDYMLKSALPGTDIDPFMQQCLSVYKSRKTFLHADRRTAAAYISGERLQVFNCDQLAYLLKLIPPRPDFATTMTPEELAIIQRHVIYWKILLDSEDEVGQLMADHPALSISRYEYHPMSVMTPSIPV